MEVTALPIVAFCNLEQPKNAELPMEVTESGMIIPVRLEQRANAELLIPFVSLFNVYVVAVFVITPTAHLSAYLTLSTTGRLVHP